MAWLAHLGFTGQNPLRFHDITFFLFARRALHAKRRGRQGIIERDFHADAICYESLLHLRQPAGLGVGRNTVAPEPGQLQAERKHREQCVRHLLGLQQHDTAV